MHKPVLSLCQPPIKKEYYYEETNIAHYRPVNQHATLC